MSFPVTTRGPQTAADWTAANPILDQFEVGIEINPATGKYERQKMGDGRTAWNSLPYMGGMLAVETLTDGATITWTFNGAESRNAKVTLGGNRTLALSGCSPGASGTLIVVQGSGGQTLALPSGSYVVNAGAGVATLSSGAADRDVLSFFYVSATEIYWTVGLDFTAT